MTAAVFLHGFPDDVRATPCSWRRHVIVLPARLRPHRFRHRHAPAPAQQAALIDLRDMLDALGIRCTRRATLFGESAHRRGLKRVPGCDLRRHNVQTSAGARSPRGAARQWYQWYFNQRGVNGLAEPRRYRPPALDAAP